jgi:hypothetical protein
MYKVYLHTTPSGKYYVGQTRNPLLRWSNGMNYCSNRAFYREIKECGWENVKHEILYECESRGEAEAYEKMFIILLDSENPDIGYNNSNICHKLLKFLDRRYEYVPTKAEKDEVAYINTSEDSNPFDAADIPTSEADHIIDDWIYNEMHRTYIKERFINGMSFPEISKKYGVSVRQLKRIIYDGKYRIEQHI